MWKGVTEFLENVDQKAAEFAQRREDQSPQVTYPQPPIGNSAGGTITTFGDVGGGTAEDDEDWDLEAGLEKDDEAMVPPNPSQDPHKKQPLSLAMPPPPVSRDIFSKASDSGALVSSVGTVGSSSSDVAVLKQQLATLSKRLADVTRAAEAEALARDKAYTSLQGDYEAIVAKNRSLAIEVDHWRAQSQQSDDGKSALELRAQALETELADLRAQKQRAASEIEQWEMQCNEQLSQLDEQRRELVAVTTQARKATDSANTARAELSDYRLRSKILLDEKDKQIADLRQALESTTTSADASKAQQHEQRASDSSGGGRRPEEAYAELELSLKQSEARIRALSEQLQQKTNELDAAEESIKSQQLLNAQLKELLDSENSAKAAAAKSFESRIAEKQATIDLLEKRLSQGGTASGGGGASVVTDAELERRSKELAQLLMEKQSALEAKRAEVDQWRTRYEVSQQRLREAELVSNAVQRGSEWGSAASRRQPRFSDVGSAEAQSAEGSAPVGGESITKHRLMTQLASRGGFGANVVRAADQIDRFSFKAGGILRRNSLLRVFVVLYVSILQLYIFVLFSFSSSIPSGNAHEGVPLAAAHAP